MKLFHPLKHARWTYWHQGAFDSFEHEHLPRTKYDITVDESSNKPGEQAFEVVPSAHVNRRSLTVNVRNSFLEDIWGRSCDSSSAI